jgi:hypothetical protein
MSTVFLEESRTAIYDRIARAIGREFVRRGMAVMMIKPWGFNSVSFRQFLREQGAGIYVSMTGANIMQSRSVDHAEHFFETFPGRVIFVHQDAILGGLTFDAALARLQAYQRVAHRSWHLCIEPDTITALKAVGIDNASLVPHASEFEPLPALERADCTYGASFVGHALPFEYQPRLASRALEHMIDAALRLRMDNLAAPAQPLLCDYADRVMEHFGPADETGLTRWAYVHWLRSQFTARTMPFRGWVLEQAQLPDLTVVGGDPAYLHRVDRCLTLKGAGIRHLPPIYEVPAVRDVFRHSACSINITSLQFDHAVVNRFHDVFLAGGLCLTDARSGVAELTSEHAELTFRTVDELRERVHHFSAPRNSRQRALLIAAVQRDVQARSGYVGLADQVQTALDALGV